MQNSPISRRDGAHAAPVFGSIAGGGHGSQTGVRAEGVPASQTQFPDAQVGGEKTLRPLSARLVYVVLG